GYKINNPTILARITREELEHLFRGYGYTPYFVEGSEPESMHQAMAATLEHCVQEIRRIQEEARRRGVAVRPRWPMVILRSPKGWPRARKVDGHYPEGVLRAHPSRLATSGPTKVTSGCWRSGCEATGPRNSLTTRDGWSPSCNPWLPRGSGE